MRVLGYMILQYGKEYLRESLLSVIDHVEQFVVLYTAIGSQGNRSEIQCPESREELYAICQEVLGEKLIWVDGEYGSEGEHRGKILNYSAGYDLILTVDSDEVYNTPDIESNLKLALKGEGRYVSTSGFINLWRSFDYACFDGYLPCRIINLHRPHGTFGSVHLPIYHFSCCQSEQIIRYKWRVSGHANELRSGWIDDILYKWTPENNFGDLHPVALSLWNAAKFDKQTMPDILKQHPNFNKYLV